MMVTGFGMSSISREGYTDRRFYHRKYDAAKILNQFSQSVRDEGSIESLTDEVLRVVQQTMQPESVFIWLNDSDLPKGGR